MRLSRVPLMVRVMMVVVTIVTAVAGLSWVGRMTQSSRHYAAQAAIQARLETLRRQEEERRKGEPPGLGDGDVADMEPRESEQHADLRRRYERLAAHPWETPPADLPMPFPWNRDRDRQVIEAALDDLMDPKNPDNAIALPANVASGSEVVLSEMTYEDREPLGEGPGRTVEDEASFDLTRRNRGGGLPLKDLGPGWRRQIRFVDIERLYDSGIEAEEPFWDYFHQCYPDACGYLDVSLPGYSRDGRTAIVDFSRPSYHGQSWTYVLNRTVTGWSVSRRQHHVSE